MHASRVVRVWKGYGTPEGVGRYCHEHFATAVMPALRAVSGFVDANVLVRAIDHEVQVVVATTWESIDAVKDFAGPDYERAVIEPVVSDLLERFDDHVAHFTVELAAGVHR
jgi:heme-degrading monooxygenase HmoA